MACKQDPLGDLSHLMLDSQRVLPRRFQSLGFAYRFPSLGKFMKEVFRRV